eukprot:TRINITY_DN78812_c0_g1_i1.p1 TRINITY_DN78812_c0_g1~~TRINITY_DN78812_c0_g1_i1.p1  ORF type:complete len:500 (-),score=31.09 TRINITY_DN78812_c0_g1_i1:607-2106(-)
MSNLTSRKRRRCSGLPVDAWRQVASHLPASDLSNLALVSKTCRLAALSPDLFAKHIRCQPPSDLLSTTSYQAIYRASKSLQHAPNTSTLHSHQLGNVGILGSVSKYLILYNEKEGLVSCTPTGWRRSISQLLTEKSQSNLRSAEQAEASSDRTISFPTHEFVAERFLELPSCRVGFICSAEEKRGRTLRTICAKTGDNVEEVVLSFDEERADLKFSIANEKRKVALLGGVHSQYVVYYTLDLLNVVSRSTGSLLHTWPRVEENMLVRGETSFNTPLITGFISCDIVEDEKVYHVHPLEGGLSEYNFSIDIKDQLIDVTRSRDGKTITKRISSDGVVKLWTVVRRDSIFHWLQALSGSNEYGVVEMRSNGSQVFVRPDGGDGRIIRLNYDALVRVDRIARRIQGMSYDWARASWDGRIVLAVSRRGGFISMFDCDEGICLKSVSLGDELKDLILVDGHLLVCLTAKAIIECHFERFCQCREASEERWESEESGNHQALRA